jgi:hypothetical protein
LPATHGAISLAQGNPQKALEVLQAAEPYELGYPTISSMTLNLYPVYVRGLAYLASKQGPAAVAEFQKILDHQGIVVNEPIGALARLGMARAQALAGDTAAARKAYEDFLDLWKDADPDIPVLKQARVEYERVRGA